MKKIKFVILSVLLFLALGKTYACQDLDELSIFGGSPLFLLKNGHKYQGPETKDRKKFDVIPGFKTKSLSFKQCRHSLWIFDVQLIKSKTTFKALVSYEDRCDGGNTHGALFSQDMKQIVATIEDSEIFCLETR